LGQKQTFAPQNCMSALPPKADIRRIQTFIWTGCPLSIRAAILSCNKPGPAEGLLDTQLYALSQQSSFGCA
jgi:hypothetical protein